MYIIPRAQRALAGEFFGETLRPDCLLARILRYFRNQMVQVQWN